MEKSLKLIKLYTHICELYESALQLENDSALMGNMHGQITDRCGS